ncbi:MAG: glycosyltransferase family 2 protein [Planctomycetota bacterium]
MSGPIAVIIPVYNAAAFVGSAVASALAQHETAEVVLVDDGSTDGSLEVCQALVATHPTVRLLQSDGSAGRGPAAARNRGIVATVQPFVAFLDADDRYLPGRFADALPILLEDPGVAGVHQATVAEFVDPAAERAWFDRNRSRLIAVRGTLAPGELVTALLRPEHGTVHLNALLLRRAAVTALGGFDERLPIGEDTDLLLRLAATSTLVAGPRSEPVAVRRVHLGSLTMAAPDAARRRGVQLGLQRRLFHWACSRGLDRASLKAMAAAYLRQARRGAGATGKLARLSWFALALLDVARRAGAVALAPARRETPLPPSA